MTCPCKHTSWSVQRMGPGLYMGPSTAIAMYTYTYTCTSHTYTSCTRTRVHAREGGDGLGLLLYIHRYPCQTFACKGRYCVCSAYVIHVITRVMGRGVLTLLMVLILGINLLFWSWKGCNGAAHRQLASYAPSLDVYGVPLTRVRHVIHVQGMYRACTVGIYLHTPPLLHVLHKEGGSLQAPM